MMSVRGQHVSLLFRNFVLREGFGSSPLLSVFTKAHDDFLAIHYMA